ncbi:MAG TPA: MarR family transcriptional regulator [Thermoplasmata archaeon]|nr:MarR family transcriptional regulator [Thermoplasmata archaeon]
MSSTSDGSAGRPPNPADRLARTVGRLVRNRIKHGREEARALGLTLPQLFVLVGLREFEPMPVSRWTDAIGVSPSATTGLLDGLEEAGYLARVHGRTDRRQVLISLTPAGRRLGARVERGARARWRAFCRGVSEQDLGAAADTLERIVRRMGPAADLAPRGRPRSRTPPGTRRRDRRSG